MGGDEETSKQLESKASELIDGASDDDQLDEAANILAEAERLKGPLDKTKSGSKGASTTGDKPAAGTDSKTGSAGKDGSAGSGSEVKG